MDRTYYQWAPANDETVWYLRSQTTRKTHTIINVEKT